MVLTEFDEAKYLKMMRKEEWEDGHAVGLLEGETRGRIAVFVNMLSDFGDVPSRIIEEAKTLDEDSLKAWTTRLASRANNMEEFLKSI